MDEANRSDKESSEQENDWLAKLDDFARKEPAKALAAAFGAGLLINRLPLGTIVGGLTSLTFSMGKPVLLFLGIMKGCELCTRKDIL
jgi:hypothetical protein